MTTAKILRKGLLILLLLIVALLLIVLTSLSYTVPAFAKKYLAGHNIELEIEELNIQLRHGEVTLTNLSVGDIDSDQRVTIKNLHLKVDLVDLARNKAIHVLSLNVDNTTVPITRIEDKSFLVAGINLDRFAGTDGDQTTDAELVENSSMSFSWGSIQLSELSLLYSQYRSSTKDFSPQLPLTLHSISVGTLNSLDPKTPTPTQAKISLADIHLIFAGDVAPLANGTPGHVSAKLTNLDINKLITIADKMEITIPPEAQNAEGLISYQGGIDWWLSDNRTFIKLNDSELTATKLFADLSANKQSNQPSQTLTGDIRLNAEKIELSLGSPMRIVLTEVESQQSQLSYVDDSLSPATKIELTEIDFILDRLTTAKPEQKSKLVFHSKIGRFGLINGNADISLLNPKSSGLVAINGEQIRLSDFSGLSNEAINKRIDKGALDFDFKADIANGIIDSKIELEAHQLTLSNSSASDQASQFETSLGMPINTVLNLLRDKDDSIRLKIPIKGPLDQPEININHIINKAIFKTVQTAVLAQVGPLMLLSALDTVKTLADATKLKPVLFESMQQQLSDDELKNLDRLADFLLKRDKLILNVCGVAASAEINNVNSSIPQGPESEQLILLAESRATFAKNYLIEKNISGKRLVLCAAKIDFKTEAHPRVDFSL